jgi:hypothetical protein
LKHCRARNLIFDEDVRDLEKLMELRNPLSHFRHVDDASNLDRRSIESRKTADELLWRDAIFAIGLAVRMLAKPPFKLGPSRREVAARN